MSEGLILELNEFILEGVIKFVEKHGVDASKQLGLELFEETDSIWYGNLLDEAIKRIDKKIPVGNGDSGALVVNGESKIIGIQFAGEALEEERKPGEPLDDSLKPSVKTNHPRVFYATEDDRYRRGELSIASKVADRFPDYTMIITMGPYRGYNVAYRLKLVEKQILLDFYSPRLPSNSDVVDIIEEIAFKLNKRE